VRDGWVTACWTQNLSAHFDTAQDIYLLYSSGSIIFDVDGHSWLKRHTDTYKRIDMRSGAIDAKAAAQRTRVMVAHGSLMTAAFGVVLPGAILAAWLQCKWWLKLYAFFHALSLLLALAGVVMAIVMVEQDDLRSHLAHPHTLVGIALVALLVVQNLLARCRSSRCSQFTSLGLVVLGCANVMYAMIWSLPMGSLPYLISFGLWLVVMMVAAGLLVRRHKRQAAGGISKATSKVPCSPISLP
jgi:hypothetical protein